MSWHDFQFNGADLTALPAGALWWQDPSVLCVSDLHLGKSERIARRSGLLTPPYDTLETLVRLSALLDQFDPRTVICLGDSFDDLAAGQALSVDVTDMLKRMIAGRTWIWITGNHDPGPIELPGSWQADLKLRGLTFRHIAEDNTAPGEVSGHYHPKANLRGKRRPCFCYDANRLILPAFGTYTGGLRASDPVISGLFEKDARAVMIGTKSMVIPLRAA